jgi:hypothetical protein
MSSHLNLPPAQRPVQRLVDHFNTEEEIWRALAEKRRIRRLSHRRLSLKR